MRIYVHFGQLGWWAKYFKVCEKVFEKIPNLEVTGFAPGSGIAIELDNLRPKFKMSFDNRDVLIKNFLRYNIDYKRINEIEENYNVSGWFVIYAERRFTSHLWERKFENYKYTHEDVKKIFVGIFDYFENSLKDVDVLLTYPPASAWGLAMIMVAKKLGVKIVTLHQVNIPKNFAAFSSSIYQKWTDVEKEYLKSNNSKNEKVKDLINEYREKLYSPSYLSISKTQSSLTKYFNKPKILRYLKLLYKNLFTQNSNFEISNPFFTLSQFFKFKLRKYLSQIHLKNLFLTNLPQGEKFFFPLHVMPEAMVLINGTKGLNQAALIEKIAYQLPMNSILVVKEHPTMIGWRSNQFYHKINSIPNVVFIRPDYNIHKIINKSKAIITISGSTGFEAIILKKPVLLLGRAFYELLPNVKRIVNLDELSIGLEWVDSEFFHNELSLLNFIDSIIKKSIEVPENYLWEIGDDDNPLDKLNNYLQVTEDIADKIINTKTK